MLSEAIQKILQEQSDSPLIHVQDYGQLTLEQAKDQVMQRMEEAINILRRSDDPDTWRNVYSIIGTGIMGNMLRAIVQADHEAENAQSEEGI